MQPLSRQELLDGLQRLHEMAKENDVLIELSLYGGAALAIAYRLRDITKDVDVFIHKNAEKAKLYAREVAKEKDWSEDWLNDGVKGFLSHHEEMIGIEQFQNEESGLRLSVASPHYLFAMKCMAMRTAEHEHQGDYQDIVNLAKLAGITNTEEAIGLIENFYGNKQVPAKVFFGVQEIMEKIQQPNEPTPKNKMTL